MTAADGREYFSRGPKIGEIVAEKIQEESSVAVPLTGTRFKVGQVIKYK